MTTSEPKATTAAAAENADGPAVEMAKLVKRSGAFDKIKKGALEQLEQMSEVQVSRDFLLNMVRINFEKQSKERKYPIAIAERRAMLKNMLSGATVFDSLTNSIQHSDAYKLACQNLSDEVDKVAPEFFPELQRNPMTNEWEVPTERSENPNEPFGMLVPPMPLPPAFPFGLPPPPFMAGVPPFMPPPPQFLMSALAFPAAPVPPAQPQLVDDNQAMDMELESDSSASSGRRSPSPQELEVNRVGSSQPTLPPPPAPPCILKK